MTEQPETPATPLEEPAAPRNGWLSTTKRTAAGVAAAVFALGGVTGFAIGHGTAGSSVDQSFGGPGTGQVPGAGQFSGNGQDGQQGGPGQLGQPQGQLPALPPDDSSDSASGSTTSGSTT